MTTSRSLPLMGLVLLCACNETGAPVEEAVDLHVVQRSDLHITVREQAEVQAARQTSIRSELEGRDNTLIYLIPEGSVVEEGEILFEIDVSEIEEKQATQAIAVAKADATYEQARTTFEIMEKELEAKRNAAESAYIIAVMEMEKFLGGVISNPPENGVPSIEGTNREMLEKLETMLAESTDDGEQGGVTEIKYSGLPTQVRKILGSEDFLDRDMGQMANQILAQIDQIVLARAELELRRDTFEHSVDLAEKDFITRNELERDRLSFESQQSRVTLSWNDIDLLINYTLMQEKIRLEQDVLNADLERQSVMAGNDAQRVKAKADLESSEAEFDLATERLANWEKQIANAVARAPTPGLVVYAKQGRGMSQQPVEEGMQVHRRKTLIVLPDVTNMVLELSVHEADIDKVAPTQRAVIEVDAFPERHFTGTVSRVSALPDSGSMWTNDDLKVYKTRVAIDGENNDRALKPGMNATVEIQIGVVRDVLTVPKPAVQRQGAVYYAWKRTASGPVAIPVQVGRNNLTHVEIVDGLLEGDTIHLAQPAGAEPPEFEQPDALAVEAVLGDADAAASAAAVRRQARQQAQASLSGGGAAQFLERLRLFASSELPNYGDRLEEMSGLYRLLSDDAFLDEMESALQTDPALLELWQAYQELQANPGQGPGRQGRGGPRGRGGPGRGGRRGQDRGGDGAGGGRGGDGV